MNSSTQQSNLTNEHKPYAVQQPISPKIKAEHLERNAALYIRQSTMHQLREHQESTMRQYQLKDRLIALGWRDEQVAHCVS